MPVRFAILGPDPTDEDVDDFLGALGVTKKLEEKVEERYSPDQPRVPAGVSDQGGEWTAAAGFGGKTAPGPDIEAYNGNRGLNQIEPSKGLWTDAGAGGVGDNDAARKAKIEAAKDVAERLGMTDEEIRATPFGSYNEFSYFELSISENAVAALHDQWADTSGDSSETALALQEVARQEFGLKGVDSPLEVYSGASEVSQRVFQNIKDNGALYRAYVHAEYDNTQEYLSRNGITELVLYRGVGLKPSAPMAAVIGDSFTKSVTVHMTTNPLSSFSATTNAAAEFAVTAGTTVGMNGYILSVRVPASRIFSTPMTGAGCLNEFEAIVLGSSGDTAAAWRLN